MAKKPLKAAVLGHPVSHSISPAIFAFLAPRLGKELEYERQDVPPAKLRAFVKSHHRDYLGWNVTLPHKEAMAKILRARLSPTAAATGAVNVVKGGKGFNTDVLGVSETLREQKQRVRGARALVLGAGGAAAAVGFALGQGGAAEVLFLARSPARARALMRRLSRACPRTRFHAQELGNAAVEPGYTVVINSTPLGMKGFPSISPMDAATARLVARGGLAFDLVYRPENTPFLKQAKRLGLRPVGGLDMLLWQAIATWEIWFGPIRSQAKRRALKAALARQMRKVILR